MCHVPSTTPQVWRPHMHPVLTALLCSCAEDLANFGLARRGQLRGPAASEQAGALPRPLPSHAQ